MREQLKRLRWAGLGVIAGLAIAGTLVRAGVTDFAFERLDPEALNFHPAYAQATTVRGDAKFIYVAGQVDRPKDYTPRSNRCRHSDMRGQYIGTHENVERALTAAGAGWNDVVFIRRYVTDLREWREALDDEENPVPNYWEGHRPPPSTLIQVEALSETCQKIEVDVFAAVPDPAARP